MEEDFIDACDVLQELCGLLSGVARRANCSEKRLAG